MNITEEYWEVEGKSLHTWANSIETLDGRDGLPPKRGQNEIVAYRPGEVWRPKVFAARRLTLALWVKGSDDDGVIPTEGGRAQFRENLEAIKSVFAVTDRELVITRRIRTLAPSLLVQTGKAELIGVLEPNMQAKDLARFMIELNMADPFWYGEPVTQVVPRAGATVLNDGTYTVVRLTVRLNGPLTNPQLVNLSSGPPVVALSYVGDIAGGDYVEFNTVEFTARDQDGVSVLGLTSHSGSRTWMLLVPGGNAIVLNAEAGTGTADITYAPAYL